MKVKYVCFEISGNCNMFCKFCFSNWRLNTKQMSTEKAKHIISSLVEHGLEVINLTGGDPLLRDDIVEICKFAKEKGLKIIISTNGILLPQKQEILNYIDFISLPLDCSEPKMHNEMRPCALKDHHAHVLHLIDFISQNYPAVKIKINTMVGKKNINDVLKIGEIINGKVYRWKVGKFFASGSGKSFDKEFSISDSEFNGVVEKINKKYKELTLVEEDFNFKESFIFIDSLGCINKRQPNGEIVNCGEIENLDKVEDINDFGFHYDKFYKEGEKK